MTYLGSGDPVRRRTDYSPTWLANLADDVILEGSAMEGTARGPDAVRSILIQARKLYEYQDINYAGPYRDNDFLEDYSTEFDGVPMGVVVLVTRDAVGAVREVAVNQRPRSSVLRYSRLMGEKLAGTPLAQYFLAGDA